MHHRVIATDVEYAVTTQEIQIRLIIHVVEVCALRSRIYLVEPDDPLSSHQGWVHVALVQLIVFTQPRRYDFLQIKSHWATFCEVAGNATATASNPDKLDGRLSSGWFFPVNIVPAA